MNSFSIAQLQQFSGVKAHTIRIWEQRYDALSPNRSEGNTRNYDNAQLRRLLNIVSLLDAGYKVSKVCTMTDEDLHALLELQLNEKAVSNQNFELYISQLLAAGMDYNQQAFEKVFASCVRRFGLRNSYQDVIYPMLSRIGLMWTCDVMPPAQEHFITNLLRQKLLTAIDTLPFPKQSSKPWLLFLPEDEFHELGLLLASYMVRQAGQAQVYLGTNLPFTTLKSVVDDLNPSRLLFFWVHNRTPEEAQQYLDDMRVAFPDIPISAASNQTMLDQLKPGEGVDFISSIEDLEKLLS